MSMHYQQSPVNAWQVTVMTVQAAGLLLVIA